MKFGQAPAKPQPSPSHFARSQMVSVGALERSSGFLSSHDPMYSSVVPDTSWAPAQARSRNFQLIPADPKSAWPGHHFGSKFGTGYISAVSIKFTPLLNSCVGKADAVIAVCTTPRLEADGFHHQRVIACCELMLDNADNA